MARRQVKNNDFQLDLFAELEQETEKKLDLAESLQKNINNDVVFQEDYVKLQSNEPLPNNASLESSKIDIIIDDVKQNLKEAVDSQDAWAIETFGLIAMLADEVKAEKAEQEIVGSNPSVDKVATREQHIQQLADYLEAQGITITNDNEATNYDRKPTIAINSSQTSDEPRLDRNDSFKQTNRSERLQDSRSLGIQPTRSSESNAIASSSNETVRATETRDTSNDLRRIRTDVEARDDRNGNIPRNGATNTSNPRSIDVSNYHITEIDQLGVGGAKTKFKNNIAALTLLKLLQSENKQASPEQQAILVKYSGWGGLSQAFDANNPDWSKEYNELVQLLPKELYEKARRSTQDSHYTPPEIVNSIYNGLLKAGFTGGSISEPSSGTGHFIGLAPEAITENSKFVAVELDPLTSDIAKQLYPNATHINKGYQEVNFPDNTFDVIVGNPPFGSQRLNDFDRPELADFSIHNYFMAKSLETLKAGGISAFVVSRHFMDSKDTSAREFIAEKAHLLGAVRLPNNAFKSAGTDVTTDIIFLQKALENEIPEKSWVKTEITLDKQGEAIPINKYFYRHPEQMIGRMEVTNKGRVGRVDCVLDNSDDIHLEQMITAGLERVIPENCFIKKREQAKGQLDTQDNAKEILNIGDYNEYIRCNLNELNIQVGSYFIIPDGSVEGREGLRFGKIAIREPDVFDRENFTIVEKFSFYEPKNTTEEIRIKNLINIRNTVYELINQEQSEHATDDDLKYLRTELNHYYDRFVGQYGYLNSQANRLAFKEDPSYCLLQALEVDYNKGVSRTIANKTGEEQRKPSAKKADIFSKRVLKPKNIVTHVDTAVEALTVSMNETGKVDINYMSQLLGKPFEEYQDELQGLIYKVPHTDTYESKDIYLTGNVKEKLKIAKEAGITDNIMALERVQPADIEAIDISVALNSAWLPKDDVVSFTKHILGEDTQFDLDYQASIGKWMGVGIICKSDITNTNTWGTIDYNASDLIQSILNNIPIKVYHEVGKDETGKPIRKVEPEKTIAANQKADEIKQAFTDWVWENEERRERLAKLYNEKFNTYVPRTYDGSHLQLVSMSQAINLRPHQKNAIWRGIQEGKGLFDHTVGAGKTMVMIATMIEQKRMGLINKPMAVVPNHLLLQWNDEIYKMYPNAKVLIAGKDDFTKENRQKLFGKIATGDWDMVVVGHSSFNKIGMPKQALNKILNEQVTDIANAVAELKGINSDSSRITIKRLEAFKERLEAKLEKKTDQSEKDKTLTFDQLGIDCLVVDESQEFKNLLISTSMSNIAGLGNLSGSDKAFDLFVKARYLQDKYNGKGIYFATGTSISNTIAEVYTLQRYMQYDELKAKGIHLFDSWASTFGQVVAGWELDATGVNYRINNRFSKFQNIPELISMYRSFADVITKEDLQRQAQELGERFPTPKIKGGKPQNIVVERSAEQAEYMGYETRELDHLGQQVCTADGLPKSKWNEGSIIYRMENLPEDPRKDNPLKITNDARKAGLDMRLIDPNAPDHPNSKVNTAIDNIFKIWQENDYRKGTQLVFCDLSTPKGKKNNLSKQVDQDKTTEAENNTSNDDIVFSVDDILANESDFSVYDDIKTKLIAKGVPEHQIRFIHDANTDVQKQKLFKDMNNGDVRILLGSTTKMGAGTNVQKKLVHMHELDCPWRPSDVEQRRGRIERQGNEFYQADPDGFEIGITRYATKQTYDARMWQTIEQKATSIEQFRRGDMMQRVIDDVAGEAANASEMKAASTGNPLIFAQVQIATELKKVEAMHSNFKRSQYSMEKNIKELQTKVDNSFWAKKINQYKEAINIRDNNTPQDKSTWSFSVPTTGQVFTNEQTKEQRLKLGQLIEAKFIESKRLYERGGMNASNVMLGEYRGFIVKAYTQNLNLQNDKDIKIELTNGKFSLYPENLTYKKGENFSLNGFITRCDNAMNGFEKEIQRSTDYMKRELTELASAKEQIIKPFPQNDYLEALREDSRQVIAELRKIQADPSYQSNWQPITQEKYGLDFGLDTQKEPVSSIEKSPGDTSLQPLENRESLNTKLTLAIADKFADKFNTEEDKAKFLTIVQDKVNSTSSLDSSYIEVKEVKEEVTKIRDNQDFER